jgi:hypothetical protein
MLPARQAMHGGEIHCWLRAPHEKEEKVPLAYEFSSPSARSPKKRHPRVSYSRSSSLRTTGKDDYIISNMLLLRELSF